MTRMSVQQPALLTPAIVLGLLLPIMMAVALLVVWTLSESSFLPPAGDTIALSHQQKASIQLDDGQCPVSIEGEGKIVDETLQSLFWACIEDIRKAPDNKIGKTSLPHEWRSDERLPATMSSMRVLYSIDFPVPYWPEAGLGLWSIVIPGVGQNAAVFLNGKLLGWGGSFEQPVARNHTRPMLFPISDGLIQQGDNRFDIYVAADSPEEGFLTETYLAPSDLVTPAYQAYYFFRFSAPQIVTLSTLIVSGFMCMLWFYRRKDVEYGLFALMGFSWSLFSLNQFVVDVPLATHNWNWLMQVSSTLLCAFGILFIHRFLKQKYVYVERGLLIAVAILAVVLWLVPIAWFYPLVKFFWAPLVLTGAFYILVNALLKLIETPGIELIVLSTAVAIIFLLVCHDQMVIWGVWPVYEGHLLHFGAPFLLLAFTWILLRRFVESLNSAEQYNVDLRILNQGLESRVEEKSKRIAQSYEMIRQLGQEQVVQQERSRIMRDMHDGIGVYLTSMLRQLEHDPVDRKHLKDSAHNALNDLRLMIDSLGSASTDLSAMLGMFRTRITRLVEACHIELAWDVDELPPVDDFGPERALNLLRILQEAVTNALKHSQATHIRLSASVETIEGNQSHIIISVKDNGEGFTTSNSQGNGLSNMQHRSHKIKANFTVNSGQGGTCVTVTLPFVLQAS
uniref:histidine kinase n=1 Tax=uncultured Thiotrichaceae bacterium TaxID=298394 RepID=A0A6S6SBV5_9GAMM|nr:MAG: Signal transduction histidine kinase [uncultured Thiotrichaceae bacterium]